MVLLAGVFMTAPTIQRAGGPGVSLSIHGGQKLTACLGDLRQAPTKTVGSVTLGVVSCLHPRPRSMTDHPNRLTLRGPRPAARGGPVERAEGELDVVGGAVARATAAAERGRTQLKQEIVVRLTVAAIVLAFNQLFTLERETASVIRLTPLIGLGLNLPYQ